MFRKILTLNSVREDKVLYVTYYLSTHKRLLSDRQITLVQVTYQKGGMHELILVLPVRG